MHCFSQIYRLLMQTSFQSDITSVLPLINWISSCIFGFPQLADCCNYSEITGFEGCNILNK